MIITVFTPTYNRSYILSTLYNSLTNQTNKNFEWLIVDDGSNDNTNEMVQEWILLNSIKIRYIYQPNGGKMRAHNLGVLKAKTELFVCVDSDDYLVNDAIDSIINFWNKYKNDYLSGIIAYKGFSNNKVIGNNFPFEESYKIELSKLYDIGFKGDSTLIYRTEVLRRFLFPEIKGEKFITEEYVYNQIDQFYKMVLFSKIIIICNYQVDGYTNNTINLLKNNPKGWALYFNQKIKFTKTLSKKVYFILQYISYAKYSQNTNIILNSNNKMLTIILYPLGIFLYIKKKKQFSKL